MTGRERREVLHEGNNTGCRGTAEGTALGIGKGPHGGADYPQTQQITTACTCCRFPESGIWVQLPGPLSSRSPGAAVEVLARVSPKRWMGTVCFQAQRTSCWWDSVPHRALAVPLRVTVSCCLSPMMSLAGGHLRFHANISNTEVYLMKVSRRQSDSKVQ